MHFIMRNTNLNVIQQLGCVEPGLCIGNIYLGHIVYKCMHKIAPEYLISLLSMPHRSNYSLRSSKDTLYLNIPRVD